ncbi:hypothetical protein C8J57DRAFT_1505989 [Mycena rebaudengoi]|nr:hypothetical protein C8J57DRAFT_1505989 [Mycena rebaudengoi]
MSLLTHPKLLSICPGLQGCELQPLCTAEVGVHVGVGHGFNSSDSPPANGFAFLGALNYMNAFEAIVFGKVKKIDSRDGHTVLTLVAPTAFVADAEEKDASSGLWVQWKDGGIDGICYWTGHSSYNGPGAQDTELEIYVHLDKEVAAPAWVDTVAYACNFLIFQTGGDREYVVRARRALASSSCGIHGP